MKVKLSHNSQNGEPHESPMGKLHPQRYHLDNERHSVTKRFEICYATDQIDENGYPITNVREGYFIVGLYNDGTPGELFVHISKEGNEAHGWANAWSTAISMLLQYGVDPRKIYNKFLYSEFAPKGISNIKEAITCKSIVDLIMKYMQANFPPTADVNDHKDDYDSVIKTIM